MLGDELMKQFSFLLLVIVFLGSQASIALANSNDKQSNRQSTKQGSSSELRVKSAQQAAQMVKRRYGGKVLKVSQTGFQGQVTYRVKLVKKDGHVISVAVNARTGQLTGN